MSSLCRAHVHITNKRELLDDLVVHSILREYFWASAQGFFFQRIFFPVFTVLNGAYYIFIYVTTQGGGVRGIQQCVVCHHSVYSLFLITFQVDKGLRQVRVCDRVYPT